MGRILSLPRPLETTRRPPWSGSWAPCSPR